MKAKETLMDYWLNVYDNGRFGARWASRRGAELAKPRYGTQALYRIHVIPKPYTPHRHPMGESV